MNDRISWKESYSVGNATLDAQHKNLLGICNRMTLCAEDSGIESFGEFHLILNDLAEYAATHFKTEEMYLMHVNYPHIGEQKSEHSAFSEQLAEFLYQATTGVIDKPALAQRIEAWWVDHILGSDMRYKSYLSADS